MAKIIKRVGIIFFVLVISCLVIMGCVVANIATSNEEIILQEQSKNLETVANSIPNISSADTVTITGDDTKMRSDFLAAARRSANESKFIKIVLGNDWQMSNNIEIKFDEQIILELNGKKISRKLTDHISGGSVFYVRGALYLTDNVYTANKESIKNQIVDIYKNKGEKTHSQLVSEFNSITCGKITGGNTNGGGGAINIGETLVNDQVVRGGFFNMYGGLIYDNYANTGGGIYAYPETIMNIYDGVIAQNIAATNGGGMMTSGKTNITGGLIAGNQAYTGGGCYFAVKSVINMNDCQIRSNSSTSGGGGIYSINSNCVLDNLEIIDNHSINSSGSGLYFNDAKASLSNSLVDSNSGYYGTGLYSINYSLVNINNCTFTNNVANLHGGGVYITVGSIAKINDCIIENNQALGTNENNCQEGGGLQAGSDAIVYVKNITVKNNYAIIGGGISLREPTTRIYLSGTINVTDNYTDSGKSDLHLKSNKQIDIDGELSLGESGIGMCVEFGEGYDKFATFTHGYSNYGNSNLDPSTLFYLENSSAKAVLKNGEVVFDYYVSSEYDFLYFENNKRKNYSENEKIHGYNDSDIQSYILGKILPNTSVKYFVERLAPLGIDKNNMKLYDGKNKLIYENGALSGGISESILDNGNELAVGTGWYIEYNKGGTTERIILSVLGDVNGDGRISASDCSYLRQIASDNALYESLSVEKKLASMVINKGGVTTADAEIVRNIIDKLLTINIFF